MSGPTTFKKPGLPPPNPFKITPLTSIEDWTKWRKSFRHYAFSVNLSQECHDVQLCIFKSLLGPDALKIYNTFSILDITDVESVIRMFDEHFKPKVNLTMERYKLYKLQQKSGQRFDNFLSEITNQVDKCEFKSLRDEIVLYKIVGGMENDEIRNALLADPDLKYDKAVQICQASTTMHFMSDKENVCKGSVKQTEELGKSPTVSHKELIRAQVGTIKNEKEVDSEIKIETTGSLALPKRSDTKKVPEKEQSTKSSKKAKKAETSIKDGLKEHFVIELSDSEENDNKDSSQNDDRGSNCDDSDWRGDDDRNDDYDYDPDHLSLEKSGAMKKHRKNMEGTTPKKKVNKKKSDSARKSRVRHLPCDICGKTLRSELALERHRSIHVHGPNAICNYCGKQFSKNFLRKHMTRTHYEIIGFPPPKFYACDVCDFKTKFGDHFRLHMYQHTGEKPLACEYCEYRCITPRLLKAHVAKLHTGETLFACSICKSGFVHSDALKRHMITHSTPEEKATLRERLGTTCEVCGKVFSSKATLATHTLRHTGVKPFACDICGFRTVTNGALTSHMMSHSDEKPFVCTVCAYSCKQKGKLQQHMMTHSNEKPYSCEVCGKKFSQSSHVKRHMLTHTGDKPHVCEICGHRWAQRDNLKAHMKVHEKHFGSASEYTPPRKRPKEEPLIIVVTAESDESEQSEGEHDAADAIITWSEQVSTTNSMECTPSSETSMPHHPT